MTKRRPQITIDPTTQPPEELRALCALCDIRVDYVRGRPGHTWRLSVSGKPSIALQSVQYEDWNEAVKTLLA